MKLLNILPFGKAWLGFLLRILIFPIALFCVALELFIEKVANLGSLSYGIEHYFKNNI